MSPSSTDRFLDAVCAEIRWRRPRSRIRSELAAHIEDRIEYLTAQRGLSRGEAEDEALRTMGDPIEIGRALNQQHRPWQFYLFLLVTTAFWCAILFAAYLLLRCVGAL